MLENAKLNSPEKVKESIMPLQVGFSDILGISNSIFQEGKYAPLRFSCLNVPHATFSRNGCTVQPK